VVKVAHICLLFGRSQSFENVDYNPILHDGLLKQLTQIILFAKMTDCTGPKSKTEGCNIRNDGSNGLALGKILTGMVFKYLFILANCNDSRQNGNFSPTGNRCGEIESTQSRSMVG